MPCSIIRSSFRIRSISDSSSFSASGLHSLISAISSMTRLLTEYRIELASSEKILINRISVSFRIIAASSRSCARFSVEISRISSISSDAFKSIRLRRYHVKSLTNCVKSRPSRIRRSSSAIASVICSARINRKSSLNTSVSTAPSTSSTRSYVSFSPR